MSNLTRQRVTNRNTNMNVNLNIDRHFEYQQKHRQQYKKYENVNVKTFTLKSEIKFLTQVKNKKDKY